MEGIGDITSDPFSRFDIAICLGLGFDEGKDLACFWQNEEQIYSSINNASEDCEGLIFIGIDELEIKPLSIYPNPSEGRFVIELPAIRPDSYRDHSGTYALHVYNSLGELVQKVKGFNNQEVLSIDLSAYSNGMYVIQLNDGDGGVYSSRVVKE